MITIRCNGQNRQVDDGTTVAKLVAELGIVNRKFAVERNREVVSRDRLEQTLLEDGDELNIVTLVGGG